MSIDKNTGLLFFNSACEVKVTVETLDNATIKTIYIKKIAGPTGLEVVYNEKEVTELIKIEANSANPILRVLPVASSNKNYPNGLLDYDINSIEYSTECEAGLSVSLAETNSGAYKYYTVIPIKTKVKSLTTTITFKYGTTTNAVKIKFYSLQGISLELDNEDDVDYGLEQRRVFGSYSHSDGADYDILNVSFANTPENVEDELYWFVKASDSQYVSFLNATSNILKLNTSAINSYLASMTNYEGGYPYLQVTIFVGNESDYSLYDNLLTTPSSDPTFIWDYYTFTFVNGCNIFDGDDFDYAFQQGKVMVFHANIGTNEDKVEGQNFGEMSDASKIKVTKISGIFGNGYTLNFEGYTAYSSSYNQVVLGNPTDNILSIISNINIKGQNIDMTKKSYSRPLAFGGGIMQYTTIQGFQNLYIETRNQIKEVKLYRVILRHCSDRGIQLDGEGVKLYVEDCILYDVAQAGVHMQRGELYIKGFFDVYNYVSPSEYEITYQSLLKDIVKSGDVDGYVDKSSGNASTYKINVAICVLSA